ncbi:EB module, partial [Cooperia oncophora]
GCPPGNFVFINDAGDTATCDPFNPPNAPCPEGFTCQWSTANQRYQCCGSNPSPPSVRVMECSADEISVNGLCLPRVGHGQDCQQSEQCTGGAVCDAGICVCPPSTQSIGGFCQAELKCAPEQVKQGNVCHNRAELGKPCEISEQCPDQASCVEGVCECNGKMINLNGKCASASARSKIVQSKSGASKCSNANSKALISADTGRVVFCSPKVCPLGRVPYLINGLPQKCVKQRCPKGYECTYKNHDYLCCSTAGKKPGKQQSTISTASK